MWKAWLFIVLASACGAPPAPPVAPQAPADGPRLTSSTIAGDAHAEAVRVDVSDVYGAPAATVQKLAARARQPLGHCLPNGGGAIQVEVRQGPAGTLEVTLVPGSSLDASARACAMDALRETFHEPTASSVGGPAIPPSGFSSLLTISW